MADDKAPPRKRLLDTSALIVGYAMSRLDAGYLSARGVTSWNAAFVDAGKRLGVPPASLKNLRDEFDPVHGNARKGWGDRPMRKSRLRVMGELCDVSDAALAAMVDGVLLADPEAVTEVVIPLSKPVERMHNVGERLRTGRMAEEFFLQHSSRIAGIRATDVVDHRLLARGYDFGVRGRDRVAIEVKGLKLCKGGVLFTDREWSEAGERRCDYWLIVVGNVESSPVARLIADPAHALDAKCQYQTAISASWRATVSVA